MIKKTFIFSLVFAAIFASAAYQFCELSDPQFILFLAGGLLFISSVNTFFLQKFAGVTGENVLTRDEMEKYNNIRKSARIESYIAWGISLLSMAVLTLNSKFSMAPYLGVVFYDYVIGLLLGFPLISAIATFIRYEEVSSFEDSLRLKKIDRANKRKLSDLK